MIAASAVLAAYSSFATADDDITAGFTLPGVTMPSGHDEVRAADGTTCRSAISGGGSYLDIGVIGNPNNVDNGASAYGRIVVPLARKRARVDCTQLYALEIERLRTELRLMQMGMDRPIEAPPPGEENSGDFDDDGWGFEGQQ